MANMAGYEEGYRDPQTGKLIKANAGEPVMKNSNYNYENNFNKIATGFSGDVMGAGDLQVAENHIANLHKLCSNGK